MSKYPNKIDDALTLPLPTDNITPVSSDVINSLRTAIVNIQTELGVKPSGIYLTLRERLDELENTIFGSIGIKVPPGATTGNALIYDGFGNWVPGNDFYDQNLTTTGTINASEFASGDLRTGIVSLSGKMVMGGLTTPPSVSDPGQGIIYFDGSNFRSSENNGPYNLLGYGIVPIPPPPFNTGKDLEKDSPVIIPPSTTPIHHNGSLSQIVIGIQGIPTEDFSDPIKKPLDGQPIVYRSGKWITSTDFGSNDVITSSLLQTNTLTISSFGKGVIKSDTSGNLSSVLIKDKDVDPNAAIKGRKINPDFGSQQVKTKQNFIGDSLLTSKISFGYPNSPVLTSGAAAPNAPTANAPNTDGSVYIEAGKNPGFWIRKSGAWSLPSSSPGGPASGDLSGNYPGPNVIKIRGIPIQPFSSFIAGIPDGYVPQIKTISGTKQIVYEPFNLSLPGSISGSLPETNQQPQVISGDVSGTTQNATVIAIQNKNISTQIPTQDQYLVFNGSTSSWTPTTINFSGSPSGSPTGGDLDPSSTYPNPIVLKIAGTEIPKASTVTVDNKVLSGTIPVPPSKLTTNYKDIQISSPPSGFTFVKNILPITKMDPQTLSGDVSGKTDDGSLSSNTVQKISGINVTVPSPITLAHDGYFLFYKAAAGATPASWEIRPPFVGSAPTGNAGGDLSGTYPNPKVSGLNGAQLPAGKINPNAFLQIDSVNPPKLKYGTIDLSNQNSVKNALPANKLQVQSLSGDLSGTVTTSVVSKVKGIIVPAVNLITDKNKFLQLKDISNYEYAFLDLKKIDGYLNLTGMSNTGLPLTAGKCTIYFDSAEKKFKASENGGPLTILSKDSSRNVMTVDGYMMSTTITGGNSDKYVLSSPRCNFSACKLDDGRVLIVGAGMSPSSDSSINIYDPYTNTITYLTLIQKTFSRLSQVNFISNLPSNKALIVGGVSAANEIGIFEMGGSATYTLLTGTGVFPYNRDTLTSAPLNMWGNDLFSVRTDDGYVLVGSYLKSTATTAGICQRILRYNQTTNSWTQLPDSTVIPKREQHTVTPIGGDKLLVAGGIDASSKFVDSQILTHTNTASPYVTVSGTSPKRAFHTATKINESFVLLVGGYTNATTIAPTDTCDLFDILGSYFLPTKAKLNTARYRHTATPLSNGNVFIAGGLSGGINDYNNALNTCEIYDFKSDTFILGPIMNSKRAGHCAVLLDNGRVLIVGGQNGASSFLDTAEIYDPITNSFSILSSTNTIKKIVPSIKIDLSNKQKQDMHLYCVVRDAESNINTKKSFYVEVSLPILTNIDHGQMLNISCVSEHSSNNDYKIVLSKGASAAPDVILYNGNFNKPTITLVADKNTTLTQPRWICIDNSG